VPRKKDPLAPPSRRRRAYEMPNLVNIQGSPDPLRQIEDDALRDLSSEYRQLRVEEIIMKKRRQLEKSSPSSDISLQKQNVDLISSIFKLAKDIQPQQGKDDTLAYVTLFKDLMLESTKIQNQVGRGPSFFESMITDPALYSRTREIFNSGKTGDTNKSDIEIEKLRGERELSGRKMDLEIKKLGLEAEERNQKLAMIMGGLSPILTMFGAKTAEDMRRRGMDMGKMIHNPNNPSPEAALLRNLMGETAELRLACECGYDKVLLIPVPPPSSITCPGCQKTLVIGPQPGGTPGSPTGSEEEGAEWKRQT